MTAAQRARIRQKIRNQPLGAREPVDLLPGAIVPMISFSRLIVVARQTHVFSTIKQTVFERVPRPSHRRVHEPKLHLGYGPVIKQSLAMQEEVARRI
jgi:hypothetical protein